MWIAFLFLNSQTITPNMLFCLYLKDDFQDEALGKKKKKGEGFGHTDELTQFSCDSPMNTQY